MRNNIYEITKKNYFYNFPNSIFIYILMLSAFCMYNIYLCSFSDILSMITLKRNEIFDIKIT